MFDIDKFLSSLTQVKLFIIGCCTTSFFWYLAIFLFGKHLITNEQVQIPIIISLCLGFLWYIFTTFNEVLRDDLKKDSKDEKMKITDGTLSWNCLGSPISLAGNILVFKISQLIFSKTAVEKHYTFTLFVGFCFFVLFVLLCRTFIKLYRKEKRDKKKQ